MQKQYSLVFSLFCSLVLLPLIPLSAQHDTIRANMLLDKGIDLYDEGDYLEARIPLQTALELRLRHYPLNHVKIEDMYYWLGVNEQDLRNNEQALEYYQKGLSIAEERLGSESIIVADFYMDMGNAYDQAYRIDEAKTCYEKTLAIYRKEFGDESSEVGNVLMNIGYGQRKMGNYHTTAQYYEQAFKNFKKSSKPTSKDFYRIYINQCNLLIDLGEYDRAMDFAEKALEIKLLHYDTLHPSVYKYFGNIGRIYQLKSQPEKALPYAQKALAIAEVTRGKQHPETAGLLGELAVVYEDLGQLEKALQLQVESVRIQEQGLPPTHPYLVAGYETIGALYEKRKDYDKALSFYQTAIEKYQSAPFVPKHLLANTLGSIAEVLSSKGSPKEALKVIQNGMQNIANDFRLDSEDIYTNPEIQKVQDEGTLLYLLRLKAKYLQVLYEDTEKAEHLEQALITSQLAIELIEKIRKSYQSEEAQQRLNAETAPVFEQAVEQAFLLYQLSKDSKFLEAAFTYSEKSKASILNQAINAQNALVTADIPSVFLDTIRALEAGISNLDERIYNGLEGDQLQKVTNQMFDLKLQYESITAQLESQYPAYFQLKYAATEINLDEWIALLTQQDATLIEYFYSEEHFYLFTLNSGGLKGERVERDVDLRSAINKLRNQQVQSMKLSSMASEVYLATLNELYSALIRPIKDQLTSPKLIIIPHGILNYLSFETLSSNSGGQDFRKINYLLKDYSIQYHWSAALWAKPASKLHDSQHSFIGFAPSFVSNNQQEESLVLRMQPASLQFALPEIEGAKEYFAGKLFTAENAKESTFHDLAPDSRIIHLATHAVVNDLQPLQSGLLFTEAGDTLEDGFLSALEVYQMRLQADLAVMSACNTGYGQLAKGEGIMSLGRAFLYAGCKSLISSLWLANDASTSEILQKFYKYAAEGMSKDEALRQAKMDYIEQADPLTAHPYFWANLIAVGEMAPLSEQSNNLVWWLLPCLFLAAGFYYLLRRGL